MTPIEQSKLWTPHGIHNGNCYAACLASLLDLPLWMIPPFEDMFGRGDWKERSAEWLKRMFGQQLVRTEEHDWLSLGVDFYIANGPSPRGVYHSVIYRQGVLAHDPHFSKAGTESVEWTWHLAPKST